MNLFMRGAIALGLMAVPSLVLAAPVGITGSVSLGGPQLIGVNGQFIDFDFGGTVSTTNSPEAVGTIDGSGDTGMFTIGAGSVVPGGTATIHDLNVSAEPVGGPDSLVDFIQFSAEPTWTITLTDLEAGNGTLGACGTGAVEADCTPTGSPFNLTNESSACLAGGTIADCTVDANFSFLGTLIDTSNSTTSNVSGIFSTTFSGTNVQDILAILNGGNGVASTASGTLTITAISGVPEPGTSAMMLLASGCLVALSRIRRRRNS